MGDKTTVLVDNDHLVMAQHSDGQIEIRSKEEIPEDADTDADRVGAVGYLTRDELATLAETVKTVFVDGDQAPAKPPELEDDLMVGQDKDTGNIILAATDAVGNPRDYKGVVVRDPLIFMDANELADS